MSTPEEYRERIAQRERADLFATIAALEAELQAAEEENERLSARCCETCEHADKNGEPWGCRANMLLFPKPTECCNHWAESVTD